MRNHRTWSVTGLLVSLVAAGGLAACGGGGSGDTVSSASLKSRLLPASAIPGFGQQRTFDWSDPVDLVLEGIHLPEVTHPSSAVKIFTDAGLRGAAGQRFTKGSPPNEDMVTVGVAELKSPGGARKARDWIHGQDLKQPCFTQCIYAPRALRVPGVPAAAGVKQVPRPGLPSGPDGPPTHYLVEFTVGPYLYFASTDGSAGDAPKVVALTKSYYERVRKFSG